MSTRPSMTTRLRELPRPDQWLIGAVVFGAASLAAGAAPNATVVIVMRIIQGVGAAILFTVSISVVTNTVAPARVQRAVGSVFAIGGLAIALGPVIGGVFTELISSAAHPRLGVMRACMRAAFSPIGPDIELSVTT